MKAEKVQHIFGGRHSIVDVVPHDDHYNVTILETERPESSITISRSMIPALMQILEPLAR
jgi:hypothetical protein